MTNTNKRISVLSAIIMIAMVFSLIAYAGTTAAKTQDDNHGKRAKQILKKMSLREKVGQTIIAGTNDPSVNLVKQKHYGGYLLHKGCFENSTPKKFRATVKKVQKAAKINMFTAVDEEGGPFTIISVYKAFRNKPYQAPRILDKQGGLKKVRSDSQNKCEFLKDLGINTNFAPVGDVPYNKSNYMWPRSFSSNYKRTSKYVSTLVRTMNKNKIVNSVKHFPGHGLNNDTHIVKTMDTRPLSTFEKRDLKPFEAGIKEGCSMIMVSHNVATAFDKNWPASISVPIHKYLRKNMGYKGVIISDSVSMDGVQAYIKDPEELAVRAIKVGNDMLCGNDRGAFTGILKAVKNGTIPKKQLNQSVLRILKLKLKMGIIR